MTNNYNKELNTICTLLDTNNSEQHMKELDTLFDNLIDKMLDDPEAYRTLSTEEAAQLDKNFPLPF